MTCQKPLAAAATVWESIHVYYNNHLMTDYRTTLQFIETPDHIARAEAEAALDALYADVLPLAPMVCQADRCRIVHMSDRELVLN